MLAAISQLSFSDTLTKDEATKRLHSIKSECAALMHEYETSYSKETKIKCLFELL